MKSKKILFQDLAQLGVAELADVNDPDKRLRHKLISDETFGRNSMIFVRFSPGQRVQMEMALHRKGHKIHTDYWPGSGTVQVQVNYFKGWHHDE